MLSEYHRAGLRTSKSKLVCGFVKVFVCKKKKKKTKKKKEEKKTITENDLGSFVGSELSSPVLVSFVILHCVCVINGVFGSVIILRTLALDRKLRQRTVTCSIYMGNLVLPNLYFQMYFFPMMIAGFVLGFYPAANELHCAVTDYLSITCYFVYQHNLIAISFDRYVRVCHPNLHQKYFTKRNTILMCVFNRCRVSLVSPTSDYLKGRLGFYKKAHACATLGSANLGQPGSTRSMVIGFTGPVVSLTVFVILGALNLRIFYAYYKIRSRVSVIVVADDS